MQTLYVLYDAHCGLCTQARDWLRRQPAYVNLRVLPSDSDEARRNFDGLPIGELAVVSDSGEVWLGENAFVICLWALRAYRGWARKLASPALRPLARQAFAVVSRNRKVASSVLGLESEAELKRRLNEVTAPECRVK
jgi:predicted DCC family thiol-disulfide oxidoreductase YuxK